MGHRGTLAPPPPQKKDRIKSCYLYQSKGVLIDETEFCKLSSKITDALNFASKNLGKYENSLSTLTFYEPPSPLVDFR